MTLNNKGLTIQSMMIVAILLMLLLVIISVTIEKNFPGVTNSYKKIENNVAKATEKYYMQNTLNIVEGDEKSVSIKRLIEEGYLNSNDCTGYGVYKKNNNKLTFKAYLKCSDYVTDGYLNYLDEK